jgi:septal ring factor EnvC (AmiA/AmiB activator)
MSKKPYLYFALAGLLVTGCVAKSQYVMSQDETKRARQEAADLSRQLGAARAELEKTKAQLSQAQQDASSQIAAKDAALQAANDELAAMKAEKAKGKKTRSTPAKP